LLPPGFLAVHPGSGSPRKNWPADRFGALVARLSPDRPWLLVEGPADAVPAAELARVPRGCRARDLPPRTLGALLSQAGAYVGNDSGVSHLSATWGAPTLALFGPTSPDIWAPLGPRVSTLRSPTGDMDGIGLDAVVTRLRELATCSAPARPSG
jgi:ADP-heptose:LPS heptosyltransferase